MVGLDAGVVHGGALAAGFSLLVSAVDTGTTCAAIYGDLAADLGLAVSAAGLLGIHTAFGVELAGSDGNGPRFYIRPLHVDLGIGCVVARSGPVARAGAGG